MVILNVILGSLLYDSLRLEMTPLGPGLDPPPGVRVCLHGMGKTNWPPTSMYLAGRPVFTNPEGYSSFVRVNRRYTQSLTRGENLKCCFLPARGGVHVYGPRPLNSTRRHGLFLKSTCDMGRGSNLENTKLRRSPA